MTNGNIPKQSLAQTLLTPAFLAKVEKLLSKVHYLSTAYYLLGLSARTFQSWRKEGEQLRDQVFNEELELNDLDARQRALFNFAIAVNRGIARAEVRDLSVIDEASLKSWRAAAWRLERRAPERWGGHRKSSAEPIDKQDKAALLELAAQVAKLLATPARSAETDDHGVEHSADAADHPVSPVAPAPRADAERKPRAEHSSTGPSSGGSTGGLRRSAPLCREDVPISVAPLMSGRH